MAVGWRARHRREASMIATLLAASLLAQPQLFAADESRFFPGSYYEEQLRPRLERRALTIWPGPTGLIEIYRSGGLGTDQKVTLLLGSAAFHDPRLIPLYRQALLRGEPRLQLAAAAAYRALLGDRTIDLRANLTPAETAALAGEMEAVHSTLRVHTLAEMWVASALTADQSMLPGYRGVVLKRRSADCLLALERSLQAEDLATVVAGFRAARSTPVRGSFMKILEGLALRRFLVLPTTARTTWGPDDYHEAETATETWLFELETGACHLDEEAVLSAALAELGVAVEAPLGGDACEIWLRVLDSGVARWWPLAARQLYNCGGPPAELSILRAEHAPTKELRDHLVRWYDLHEDHRRMEERRRARSEERLRRQLESAQR